MLNEERADPLGRFFFAPARHGYRTLLTAMSAWARCMAVAGLALVLVPTQAQTPPVWRVCVADVDAPPYVRADPQRPGIIERLLQDAGTAVGLPVQQLRAPARRCRALLYGGRVEASVAAPSAQNLQELLFPMKDGALDATRRLARVQLVWVKRRDSPLDWDGERLGPAAPDGPVVGVRADLYIASEALKALGLRTDEAGVGTRQLLAKLKARRVDLAVVFSDEARHLLREPGFEDLAVLPKPFVTANFYAVLRRSAPAGQRALAELWWREIARLRERPEYLPTASP